MAVNNAEGSDIFITESLAETEIETVVSTEESAFHFDKLDNHKESEISPTLSTNDLEAPLSNFQLMFKVKSSFKGKESDG